VLTAGVGVMTRRVVLAVVETVDVTVVMPRYPEQKGLAETECPERVDKTFLTEAWVQRSTHYCALRKSLDSGPV
jgi:hypothetical protein